MMRTRRSFFKKVFLTGLAVSTVLIGMEAGLWIWKILGHAPLYTRPALTLLEVASSSPGYDVFLRPSAVAEGNRHHFLALFEEDSSLLWRMRPDISLTMPNIYLPSELWDKTRFTLRTNERGYRTRSFRPHKDPGVLRVLCLGDSRTCGWGLAPELSYPARLEAGLETPGPSNRFEVLNLGVPVYSSTQGLKVMKDAASWEPDIVICWFGSHDGTRGPMNDAQRMTRNLKGSLAKWLSSKSLFGGQVVLRWSLLVGRWRAQIAARSPGRGVERASVEEYHRNLSEILSICRSLGARLIVLADTEERMSCGSPDLSDPVSCMEVLLPGLFTSARGAQVSADASMALKIEAWHEIHGDRVVDPSSLFSLQGQPFNEGCHLSSLGCEILAAELAQIIVAHPDLGSQVP